MFSTIKDLKDLEKVPARFSIDIKVLKALKRQRLTMEIAGDRPPRYGEHRDQEVSPTGLGRRDILVPIRKSRPGGLSYRGSHRDAGGLSYRGGIDI